MTHAQYLDAYHEESEAMRQELNMRLGRGDYELAQATLQRWSARVDALWAQVQTPT